MSQIQPKSGKIAGIQQSRSAAQSDDLLFAADVERSILGSVILQPELFHEATFLRDEDWAHWSHFAIFRCMAELVVRATPLDAMSLIEELRGKGQLEKVGGAAYISSLTEGQLMRATIAPFLDILRDKTERRRIRSHGQRLIEGAVDPTVETKKLFQIACSIESSCPTNRRIQTLDQLPNIFSLPLEPVLWLAEAMIPLRTVTVLAGEPGIGKSVLMIALIRAVVRRERFLARSVSHVPIVYLDRENPFALVRERFDRALGRDAELVRYWGDWPHIAEPPPMIGDARLLSFCREYKPLLVIDSLIRFHNAESEDKAVDMAPVMHHLRALANAGGTVLAVHHRAKHENSKFRGSSEIAAGADIGMLLAATKSGLLRLEVFKNRFGAKLTWALKPDFERLTFELAGDGNAETIQPNDEVERLTFLITQQPGVNTTQLVELMGCQKERVVKHLHAHQGVHWSSQKNGKAVCYYPVSRASSAVPQD